VDAYLQWGALGLLALVLVWLGRTAEAVLLKLVDRVALTADRAERSLESIREAILTHEEREHARHAELVAALRGGPAPSGSAPPRAPPPNGVLPSILGDPRDG
jgi:hypothetical protein